MSNTHDDRREFIKKSGVAGLSALLMPELATAQGDQHKANLIELENQKLGTDDWQLTRIRPDSSGIRTQSIEGYCNKQSVKAGESIDIMVSCAPERDFTLEIFRTGYYGGKGARLLKTLGPFKGKTQVTPEAGERDMHECEWEPSLSLQIEEDWISGVYLGRLSTIPTEPDDPYWQSYIIFIVTDDRPADILFQCSDNTWQAYNQWPSRHSLYTDPRGANGPWPKVSFDRPYGRQPQISGIVNAPLSFGSGEYLCFEFPMAYFLEQHGYDVSYCTNSDMLSPERGLKCKTFLSVGHDEYWDIRQYRSVEKMRDEGVTLLFFSGNAVCWVTPFSDNAKGEPNRRIVRDGPYGGDYKYAVLRQERSGPFPQNGPDEGYLMGVRNISPITGGGDWIITKPDHWIFEGTGIKAGDRIPGLVGWEYHGDAPDDIPGLEVLAKGTAWSGGERPQYWEAAYYPGPKGNFVFNASTIFWCQGLSHPPGHVLPWSHFSRPHGPDARVQQITHNLLNRAIQ